MSFGIVASSYAVAGGGGVTDPYGLAVLADSPLLYWRMSDTSGTSITDFSGNGRHGTYINSPTLNTRSLLQGSDDPAVYFENASSQNGSLAYAAWMNTTSFTITCIVQTIDSGIQILAGRYHDPDNDRTWFLYADGAKFKLYVRSSAGAESIVATSDIIQKGKTCFVAAYAGPAGVGIRVYDYGNMIGSASDAGVTLNSSTRNFTIAACDPPGGQYYAECYLDEVVFYGTALSDARIDELAAIALFPQPQWLLRSGFSSPRLSTTTRTLTFSAPATAGSLLVLRLAATEVMTIDTPGWTTQLTSTDAFGYSHAVLLTRVAAGGEDTVQLTIGGGGDDIVTGRMYEFAAGSTFLGALDDQYTQVWPTLSGLPGTNRVTAFGCLSTITTDLTVSMSSRWSYGWKSDADSFYPSFAGMDGLYDAIGYIDRYTPNAVTPSEPDDLEITINGPAQPAVRVVFAVEAA